MWESKPAGSRRCAHCGRPVSDTLHYRDTYVVDFHFLYTGDVEQDEWWDERAALSRTVVHIRNPRFVFTCTGCYRRPEVQRELERLYRPELEEADEAGS
ncbi:MAG: hypothetical protein KatS3mg077_0858 [Candidatus Binatia bacterium]|nr:MAG: hypothetical protein KatS3mg077_0858 [Candidatus Binatia bacterium]